MIRLLLYWCMLLFLFLCSCTSKTVDKVEQKRNDSIQKYLDLAGSDTVAYEKRIKYNDKAYSLIDLNRNDTVSISLLHKTTVNFYRFNKMNELKYASNIMLKRAFLLKDDYWISLSYKILGLYYMNNSENEKALYYFFKAKKNLTHLKDHKEIINLLYNICLTQYYAGDFLGSNKTAFEVLKMQKKYRNNLLYGAVYNQIGNNLACLKQYNRAIEYFNKINRKKCSLNIKNMIAINISSCYIEIGEYKNAYDELDSIIKNKELKKVNPNYYGNSLSIFGYCKLKMNNLKNLPGVFFIADDIYKKSKTINGRNYNQMYLSMYYKKRSDTINAIKAAKKALSLSKSYKNPSDILVTLEQLIKVDKENASTNAQEYIRISDSMQISERNFRDKFARIAYETEEVYQEKDKAINQKWITTAIAAVVILIVLLILIITRQRAKQKELALLQGQQKANEEIYQLMLMQKSKEDEAKQTEKKRIAQELHDGIMNKLSSTRLNLSILSNKTDKETIQKCITYINGINQIETEIRTISHDLNKELFQKEDSYTKMVEDFVKEQNKISKTHFELEIDKQIDWNTVSSEIKMHLYRIIQEATHNINKYAHAKKATISILIDYPNICMAITDNGIGFDTSDTSKGIGMQNMQARVKSLKGKFNISSKKLESTSINIAIPIK